MISKTIKALTFCLLIIGATAQMQAGLGSTITSTISRLTSLAQSHPKVTFGTITAAGAATIYFAGTLTTNLLERVGAGAAENSFRANTATFLSNNSKFLNKSLIASGGAAVCYGALGLLKRLK